MLVATASMDALRLRARVNSRIRAFFAERDVLEVETPALSTAATPDLALESFEAHARAPSGRTLYLHTSPEYAMKRLVAAGSGDVYQVCRVFRDGELGRWHQPEFVMLEWYRVGFTELELMDEVAALVAAVMADCGRALPARRVSYRDAFRETLDIDPLGDFAELPARLAQRGIDVPPGLDPGALLDLALATAVAPAFRRDAVTFVYDYPASQAALARIKPQTPPVAARFEAYVGEIELANGFSELTDAAEQRRRFEAELEARRRAGRTAPPLDEAFLAALDRLPSCAGVALGVDRLVALAAGADELAPILSFTHRQGEPLA